MGKEFSSKPYRPPRSNSNIHISPRCPFLDVWPCAPFHYHQCPRSLFQICILLLILLSAVAKLTPDVGLLKQFLLTESLTCTTAGGPIGTAGEQCAPSAASENQYCPQRGFLWDWNMCSAVLLPSHAPLPWHAMRIFTLNFVCHCLKYALWIRCYVFSLLISLSSFNWSLEASSTRVAGIILLFPWRVQLLLPFKGISQGLKLFLSVFPGIQSHAFHRLSHHPSLFCFYDQVRRDCTRFASSSLYSGFILASTYPQAFFAPQSPFFPSIMLNMCSFYKLSLCFSIPTLNFLNWQLQHCKPSTKKIPSFRKDEQSLVSQRSRLRS